MSGDGQTDIVIPLVFLFGIEASHLMDALRAHDDLVVYVGETAKQSSELRCVDFFAVLLHTWFCPRILMRSVS